MKTLSVVSLALALAFTVAAEAGPKRPKGAPQAPVASKTSLDKLKAQPASKRAARLYQETKFREAADDFKEALAVNPNNYRAAYLLGMSYLNREKWEAARDAFRKAIELGADRRTQAHIYNGLAYSYEAIHQTRMAHHYYHLACAAHKANTYAQRGATRTEFKHRHGAAKSVKAESSEASGASGG